MLQEIVQLCTTDLRRSVTSFVGSTSECSPLCWHAIFPSSTPCGSIILLNLILIHVIIIIVLVTLYIHHQVWIKPSGTNLMII